jgi:organic radical activating enzyme
MILDTLIVEITRRCNMRCGHCLRGSAQRVDMPDDFLYKFCLRNRGTYINALTISGGEPSLVPNKIQTLLNYLKVYNIKIGAFYLVTNAKRITSDFVYTLLDLYDYSLDKEGCGVHYSNDQYHTDQEALPATNSVGIEKLKALSFVSSKGNENIRSKYLLREGRAKEWAGCEAKIYDYEIEDDSITGEFYLNCLGNIIASCELSYKSQNKKENIVCNINDYPFNLLESTKQFNKRNKGHK